MTPQFKVRVTGTEVIPRKSGKPSRASLGKESAKLPTGYPGENIQYLFNGTTVFI